MRALVTGRAMTPADLALLVRPEGVRADGGAVVVEAVVVEVVPGADGGCAVLRVRFAGEWLGDLLLASGGERDRVVAALRDGAVVVTPPPGVQPPHRG